MQALLVLDVVNAIFELPVPLHDADGFVARVRGLLDRARASRVLVVHFRHLGPEGSIFAPGGRGRELDARVAGAVRAGGAGGRGGFRLKIRPEESLP